MPKLSDTQLVLLSSAAQREDLRVVLPERLRGSAAEKVLSTLKQKALIEQIDEAPAGRMPSRLSEGETPYRISAAGLTAIGVDIAAPGADQTLDTRSDALSQELSSEKHFELGDSDLAGAAPSLGSPPRSGTKLAGMIAMLQRQEGASINELTTATGWLPHTTRAALTGLRKRGMEIHRSKRDGATFYTAAHVRRETSSTDAGDPVAERLHNAENATELAR